MYPVRSIMNQKTSVNNLATETPKLIGDLAAHAAHDEREREMTARTAAFLRSQQYPYSVSNSEGHITASAWILHPDSGRVLLTHHAKLDAWFQLGGHLENDASVFDGALREAREESGLASIQPLGEGIFDVDVHEIPARGPMPAHPHYDIRYLLMADPAEPLVPSAETKSLAWVTLEEAARLNPGESIVRMIRKSYSFLASSKVSE